MSDWSENSCERQANDLVTKEYSEERTVHTLETLDCTLDSSA
jgi:hypothetical protein